MSSNFLKMALEVSKSPTVHCRHTCILYTCTVYCILYMYIYSVQRLSCPVRVCVHVHRCVFDDPFHMMEDE